MRTYVPLEDLKAELGIPEENDSRDAQLARALVLATAWVDHRLGLEVEDVAWTGDADDLDDVEDPAVHLASATMVVAIRFSKSGDVPFGIAGMSDQGMVAYVRQSIPEAELILFGHRESWGIG